MRGMLPARHTIVMHLAIAAAALMVGPRALAQPAKAEPDAPTQRFDGTWDAAIDCPNASDPALSRTQRLTVAVKEGTLHGSLGEAGKPGSLQLFGRISPDGSAELGASGLAGERRYNIEPPRGTPFSYRIRARFDDKSGTGTRLGVARCELTFTKQ